MKDFALFKKALKLNWVKRLCSNSDAPWQYIPKSLLATVGGLEVFKCNYEIGQLNLSKCLPAFYHEIITFWQDVIASNPKSKNDVLEQIVWNKKFIILFTSSTKRFGVSISLQVNTSLESARDFTIFILP